MALSKAQQRDKVINAICSREGKNTYTQSSKRDQVASGYGDCSSTVHWAYKSALGIEIGGNTEAQINSKAGKTVSLIITNGIPDESKMLPGDCLYFRGNDSSRTKGVGHVEMYIGNGQIIGHGSGIGPSRKNMSVYCRQRQNTVSSSKALKNKGLICVKRFIDDSVSSTNSNTTVDKRLKLKVGTMVEFTGSKHYSSANAATGKSCKSGKAKITQIYTNGKHQYHIVGTGNCTAQGWVNASDIKETAIKTGKIICNGLNIRANAKKTSTSLGVMKKNDTVSILGTKNGWYKICWKGITGYCSSGSKYISIQ